MKIDKDLSYYRKFDKFIEKAEGAYGSRRISKILRSQGHDIMLVDLEHAV